MKFAWWPHTKNISVASYRLRCARIVDWFQVRNLDAGIYSPGIKPEILVLSKRYDRKSIDVAQRLRIELGTQLVLDLCDNHFYSDSASDQWIKRADDLRYAIEKVNLVIASSEYLADIIRSEVSDANIVVIGDAVEQPYQPTGLSRAFYPVAEFYLSSLRSEMAKDEIPQGHRLIWYGNQGSGNAEGGMSDLSHLKDILEHCNQSCPISLSVISNNRAKFHCITQSWSIPIYYLEWHLSTFSRALKLHDIAVIPVTRNPFTCCKTNNRVASALLHNLGVVADSIPSYHEFSDCIELDNWHDGIIRLMNDKRYKEACVEIGKHKINEKWSIDHIGGVWLSALASIRQK